MATNWNILYLGVHPIGDPTEGCDTAQNTGALVGKTFGGPLDKLIDGHEASRAKAFIPTKCWNWTTPTRRPGSPRFLPT